jgi:hypothetical protein
MRIGVIVALVVAAGAAALLIGSCGESSEDKAQASVCDARARISTEVDTLKKLSPDSVTADAVSSSVDSIRGDLEEIGDSRDDLSEDRRNELKAANDAFVGEVRDVAQNVLRSTSAADAKTQLQNASNGLVEAYSSTLGTYDC